MCRPITHTLPLYISLLFVASANAQSSALLSPADSAIRQLDEYTLVADKHLVNDYQPHPSPGLVHVVVEIPSGTNAKWEVDKQDGHLKWEIRDGAPRVVKYLSYPGNYGMIPRTLLSEELDGDGDPLDVLVLGPALPRGSVVEARIIGVLKFLDGGEQDDKLIAVMPGTIFGDVHNFAQLRNQFNGALDIIERWFANYKGPGEMVSKGRGGVAEANAILEDAIKSFAETADQTDSPTK